MGAACSPASANSITENTNPSGDEPKPVPGGKKAPKPYLAEMKTKIHSGVVLPQVPQGVALLLQKDVQEVGSVLGKGGFATVYRAIWRNKDVAMKQLFNARFDDKDFIREMMVLGTIQHTNLVQLLGVCVEKDCRCLVFELMEGGSLVDRIELALEDSFMPGGLEFLNFERLQVLLDASLGLACLHKCNHLHCDIKPDNILLRADGRAALADFGLSRVLCKCSRDDIRGSQRMSGSK